MFMLLFDNRTPGAAVALKYLFLFHRATRTSGIIWEAAGGQCVPDVDHRLNHAPAGFDHVSALEERRIAGHAIAQQPFVTGAGLGAEIAALIEIHVHQAELHDRALYFSSEAESTPLCTVVM